MANEETKSDNLAGAGAPPTTAPEAVVISKAEEPKAEEPKTEEPMAEEPREKELKAEELKVEEPEKEPEVEETVSAAKEVFPVTNEVAPVTKEAIPVAVPATEETVQATAVATKVEDTAVEAESDNVPDPDEDDLDDLDDLLDDFSTVNVGGKTTAAATVPAPVPAATAAGATMAASATGDEEPNLEDILNDDEFAKQLQAGMADLLGDIEVGNSPEMQAQFASFFKELGIDTPEGVAPASPSTAGTAKAAASPTTTTETASTAAAAAAAAAAASDESFQDTIRRTMERMQASGDQATAAAAADSNGDDEDIISEFLKQLQSGGGGATEEELSKMLMGMMDELTNKEILYEPMKELNDKFPAWMVENKDKTPAEDLTRYEVQQVIVKEIVERFELPTYSDTNPADREYIVTRMSKMQMSGQPPADLVGDMPAHKETQDLLAAPDENCNPQ